MGQKQAQQKWTKTYNDKHGMGNMKIKKESIKEFTELRKLLGLNNQSQVAEHLIKFYRDNNNE